jgi:hypothetical protein
MDRGSGTTNHQSLAGGTMVGFVLSDISVDISDIGTTVSMVIGPYHSGRSPHWVKVKNPKGPAVKREVEEDWGR